MRMSVEERYTDQILDRGLCLSLILAHTGARGAHLRYVEAQEDDKCHPPGVAKRRKKP
jgi:hypothetical protein